MMQATLCDTLHFEGVGLHTGAQAAIDVRPAPPDTGLSFVLGSARVPATVEHVRDTSRATVLGIDGSTVSTTEHLLSALFALGVTNAEVHVEGPEIPALDGASEEFVDAILACGLQTQPVPRRELELAEPVSVGAGDRMMIALPAETFRVHFVADFAAPIGTQYYHGEVASQEYRDQIAGARTFAYLHEIKALWARGLGRGGNMKNALVYGPDGPMQPLRWPDEAVRHKVLDLIGDLALLGAWPRCEIVAIKSGHELHASLTRALRARLRVPSA